MRQTRLREHRIASLEGSERELEEAILAIDPTPLEESGLYRGPTSAETDLAQRVKKPNGRRAIIAEEALPGASDKRDSRAARLNDAAMIGDSFPEV